MNAQEKKEINLNVLKRHDKQAKSIIDTSSHVVVYDFNGKQWSKRGIEGSLFLYQRNGQPKYAFTIMNRLGIENLEQYLTPDLEFSLQGDYVIFKDANDEITGLWMYEEKDRTRLSKKLSSLCLEKQENHSSKKQQTPASSGSDQVDVLGLLQKAVDQSQQSQQFSSPQHSNRDIQQFSAPQSQGSFSAPPPQHQPQFLHPQQQMHHPYSMPPPSQIPQQPPINHFGDLFDRLDLCFLPQFGPRNLRPTEFRERLNVLVKDPAFLAVLYEKYKS